MLILQVNELWKEIGLIGDNLYFDRQCESRQFGSFQILRTSDFPNFTVDKTVNFGG